MLHMIIRYHWINILDFADFLLWALLEVEFVQMRSLSLFDAERSVALVPLPKQATAIAHNLVAVLSSLAPHWTLSHPTYKAHIVAAIRLSAFGILTFLFLNEFHLFLLFNSVVGPIAVR